MAAALKMQQLRGIILKAYEDGNAGCLELKDQYADELLQQLVEEMSKTKTGFSSELRIYTVEELKKFPLGTVFEHSRLGKCWVDGTEKVKTMTTEDGHTFHLMENDEPWNEPMKMIAQLEPM